jgi:hypothetical protein
VRPAAGRRELLSAGRRTYTVSLESRLRRLEREAQEEMIEIPQRDGTVARFPQSVAAEAFRSLLRGS